MVITVDKPWKIVNRGSEDEPTWTDKKWWDRKMPRCERLGCRITTLVPFKCHNPHTGLEMVVCKGCFLARGMWDEMMMNGQSKIMQIDLTPVMSAYHEKE